MAFLPEICNKPVLVPKSIQCTKRQICLRDLSRCIMSPQNRVMEETTSVPIISMDDTCTNISTQEQKEQMPLAGSSCQLNKLKRFLVTLQQFGSDISPEIGERVRTLVLALLNSHISIEDFHSQLQEATNFPLRPFVIPFLKANLPFLQKELMQECLRSSVLKSPFSYFSNSINSCLSQQTSPKDLFSLEIYGNGKRPLPDRTKENGFDCPAKRRQCLSPDMVPNLDFYIPQSKHSVSGNPYTVNLRMEQDLLEQEHINQKPELDQLEQDQLKHLDSYGFKPSHNHHIHQICSDQEDWQFVENMLNNIVIMVDRCKRIIESLEERNRRWQDETASSLLQAHPMIIETELKRLSTNSSQTFVYRSNDQLSQAHQRTEEAIHGVRMQAVLELQQAVAAAEVKASHMVAAERAKMELAILEARKQAQKEILAVLGHQKKSTENCWNCGRKANDTCSGCHVARYCGSYCQHKDWETHHHICGNKITQQAQFVSGNENEPGNKVSESINNIESQSTSRDFAIKIVTSKQIDKQELSKNNSGDGASRETVIKDE